MENIILDIIKLIIKEPKIKAVVENELKKRTSTVNGLSSICIDSKCDIYFPDYENAKLELPYQSKSLYLFYLLSPLPVSNKGLQEYEVLLNKIYQITCQSKMGILNDNHRAEKTIRGLLGKEALHHSTSEIKKELMAKIPDKELVKYYMIDGKRNCGRKIDLPKSLINVENEELKEILEKWYGIIQKIYWR